MDPVKEVSVKEVKEAFLLANAFKEAFKEGLELSIDELEKMYEKLKADIHSCGEPELNEHITDKIRLERYDSINWCKGNKYLSKMGVWPKMNDLDILLTTDSVLDTAEGVKKVIENVSGLYVPQKFRKKLDSLKKFSEFVYPHFPLVLFPGGEVREKDYNKWALEHNEPLCSIFDHDIDDGSCRSVAYATKGLKYAPVYFGKYKS